VSGTAPERQTNRPPQHCQVLYASEIVAVCIRSGLKLFEGSSDEPFRLALAYQRVGRRVEALAEVEKLQTLVAAQSGRHELDSELLRLKGELLSGPGNSIAAQQCFQEAINIACRRSAKTFEFTATTELARLVAQKGSRNEAYMMLNEIYDRFTAGFDTRHLKEAKALLDKLRS
jgi:hypothetical protein